MKSLIAIAAAAALLTAPLPAQSGHPPLHVDPSYPECHVRFAANLTQGAYGRFVREFGSVSAFRQMASPTTLGKGKVSIGIEMMSFQVDQWSDAWNDTFAHPHAHHPLGARQEFPKVKLRVGVSDDLDVGAFYTLNPNSNYGWLGVDGKYRLLNQDENQPVSLALRGAYTKTLYVDDMDMHALTADVSLERRLGRIRPYVGLGADAVLARETSDVVDLRTEKTVVPHLLSGVEVKLGRASLGAEFTWGARSSMAVQVGAVVF